jgi:signal transduction histidine kinase
LAVRNERPWLTLALGWISLSLVYSVALMGYAGSRFVPSLIWSAVTITIASLLGVAVWWLTGRVPWPERLKPGFFLFHLSAACVYAVVWILLDVTITAAMKGRDPLVAVRGASFFGLDWTLGALLYGLFVGLCYNVRVYRRYRTEQEALVRARSLAASAQLDALRAQLNPHFLFNALHSLAPLVRHDQNAAEEAIDRLGELLRYALDEQMSGDVTLADELNFVRNYLALEKLRLGGRLQVHSDVHPDLLDCALPSFTLQPIVENAIRHGIAPRPRGGTITISARVQGGRLCLEVNDDGSGATSERVAKAAGLGLRALRQRLEVRYGGAAALEVVTSPGEGFMVRLRLPLEDDSRFTFSALADVEAGR